MAKDKNITNDIHEFIAEMKDMMENMSETEREKFWNMMSGDMDMAEVENERFYAYQKPDYEAEAIHTIEWGSAHSGTLSWMTTSWIFASSWSATGRT